MEKSRIPAQEIRGRKLSNKEKIDLVVSYIMEDLSRVEISYELENIINASLRQVTMSIKDEYHCCDDEVLKRKLWKGTLQLAQHNYLGMTSSKSKNQCLENFKETNSLIFLNILEQRIAYLEKKLLCTEKEREVWKSMYDKFHRVAQKSLEELMTNFLTLYNDTKKRFRDRLLDLRNQTSKQTKNTNNNCFQEKKDAKKLNKKRKIRQSIDYEDEHDLQAFDENDVQRLALGVAVTKNSVNPRKDSSFIIRQSQDIIKEEDLTSNLAMKRKHSTIRSAIPLSSQITSNISNDSITKSFKNPYTGATEIWDPNAIFSDDNNAVILEEMSPSKQKEIEFISGEEVHEPPTKNEGIIVKSFTSSKFSKVELSDASKDSEDLL